MNIPISPFTVRQFLRGFPRLAPESQKIYQRMILRFWDWLEQKSCSRIDEGLIIQWLEERSQQINPCALGCESGFLLKFFDYLQSEGLRGDNPFRELLEHYPRKGWRGIARSLSLGASRRELDSLKKFNPFESPLGSHFRQFIQWKRSLGKKYDNECGVLSSFEGWLCHKKVLTLEEISSEIIQQWLSRGNNKNPHTLQMRINLLIQCFNFLTLHHCIPHNPAFALKLKGKQRAKPPTLLSQDQLRQIVEKAEGLRNSPLFPYRGQTCRMFFLTLYALGLRVSEACRLQLKDICWEDQTITIAQTKFFKSRLLPLADKFATTLKTYIAGHPLLKSRGPDYYLFTTISGGPLSRSLMGKIFRQLCHSLQFSIPPGHRNPCLHSFRHSFAVHRLLRWYREGADVQQKLPLLSAYLGHKDITSTQVYLEMTWELLESAQERFYMSFGKSFKEVHHEDRS